jgi:hypothetical protein
MALEAVKKCIAFPLFKKSWKLWKPGKPPNDINDLSGFQSFCGLEILETATEVSRTRFPEFLLIGNRFPEFRNLPIY